MDLIAFHRENIAQRSCTGAPDHWLRNGSKAQTGIASSKGLSSLVSIELDICVNLPSRLSDKLKNCPQMPLNFWIMLLSRQPLKLPNHLRNLGLVENCVASWVDKSQA